MLKFPLYLVVLHVYDRTSDIMMFKSQLFFIFGKHAFHADENRKDEYVLLSHRNDKSTSFGFCVRLAHYTVLST